MCENTVGPVDGPFSLFAAHPPVRAHCVQCDMSGFCLSVCLRLQVLSIGRPSLALILTVPLKDGLNSPQRLAEPKGFHYACFHWLQLRNEDAAG